LKCFLNAPAGFFRRAFCFQILLVLELSDYEDEDDNPAENETKNHLPTLNSGRQTLN